ncbi:MAG: energy transducer TonB [Candidatus Eisenbacteria bacterium]|nr:energy transducer TonB [Candidatus Eisenbacteria bacterium]
MSPYTAVHMTAEQELKNSYARIFRVAVVIAIAVHGVAFLVMPQWKPRPYQLREKQVLEAINIPDQISIPPPPKEEAKPVVPTEIEPSEEAGAEETIASTELNVEAPPELPPPPKRAEFFTAFDDPPQIIVQVPPEYPEMARMAELEGVVHVQIGVNEFGDVVEANVVGGGIEGLNQAAIEAVYKWKFRPAKQRDIPVPVRIVVPIRFTLRG